MLANASASPSRSHRPVFGGSRLLWRGSIVALTTLSIITSVGISELTARSGIEPSVETVNRTQKGDRLSPGFRIRANSADKLRQINTGLEKTSSGSRLPVGCEPLVSAFAHSQLARIAGRCMS